MGAPPDLVEFLLTYPPFNALERSEVEKAAAAAEIEFHLVGTEIFSQGSRASEFMRVIRAGAVEIVHDGRVLDLIGVGEMFGHASMLSGLPTGFAARAAEDTLTYRIPADAAYRLLGQPATLRYVTRSLLEDRYGIRQGMHAEADASRLSQPVGSLLRAPAIVCGPGTAIGQAARQMSEQGETAVVVDLGESLGIVTDRDFRSRVLAAGISADRPVSEAMSAPAETVPADRAGAEVLLDMLDRGFRHFPVVSATGAVMGVVTDHDLVEVQTHSSFALRRTIARATTPRELAAVAPELWSTVVSLHRASVPALDIEAVFSIVSDALTRRALEFALAELGEAPAPFAWLALGSQARRESVPSSDLDSALVFQRSDDPDTDVDALTRPYFVRLAARTTEILVDCGFHPDEHKASASDPLFVRSLESWQNAARSWLEDPTQDKALVLTSVLVDGRAVWGPLVGEMLSEIFRPARQHPNLLRMLARFAIAQRPPTGFLSGLVVEHSGEHRGMLDLKHGGVQPIANLARWAGLATGIVCASTPARLHAAGDAGVLSHDDASTLVESFELFSAIRLDHQTAQLTAGERPDDFIDPSELSALTRTYLKEAFRAVAGVQQGLANNLALGVW